MQFSELRDSQNPVYPVPRDIRGCPENFSGRDKQDRDYLKNFRTGHSGSGLFRKILIHIVCFVTKYRPRKMNVCVIKYSRVEVIL